MRAAVVGHVEWVDFARVAALPSAGEIVHATDAWAEPGGGGAVAAVQLARLAGVCDFLTALGDDDLGLRAREDLLARGVEVHAVHRDRQRRALTHVDGTGERTITVLGERLEPLASDPLPWQLLDGADCVYLCAGDAEAVRRARTARVLVATARILPVLREAGVRLDALVGSADDPGERYDGELDPEPALVVRTEGALGGSVEQAGARRRYAAAPVPGPVADAYGCGDSFAAALTWGLGAGLSADRALEIAARCGAAVLAGRGPYGNQLTAADARADG